MRKSIETLAEVVKDPKHPFRQLVDRPQKAQKNRYERRKIKEYLKIGDWAAESAI